MANVAQFGSAEETYIAVDLGSDVAELWVEFQLKLLDEDAFASFAMALFDSDGIPDGYFRGISAFAPEVGVWSLGEFHHVNGGDYELYVDGVLEDTGPEDAVDVRWVSIGPWTVTDTGSFQVDDVKIGTTRHGTDLFEDDFEDGTFDAWTDVVGDATIVSDVPPPECPVLTAASPGSQTLTSDPVGSCSPFVVASAGAQTLTPVSPC